jgi:mannitol/fructose-specific phosphotransferase system IIA component (Ntr-type)
MRPKRLVHSLTLPLDRQTSLASMRGTKYSRYPVVSAAGGPVGFLHAKDLLFADPGQNLEELVKPCPQVAETDSLEKVLSVMQRKAQHLALVYNASGLWTGIITLEDIIEELTGTIEEEYPVEPAVNLTDFLTPAQIAVDVVASTLGEAVAQGLAMVPEAALPCSRQNILQAVAERERLGSSYMGHHLSIPHARIDAVKQPAVFIFRLRDPIPAPRGHEGETIHLLFLLVTPATAHRVHQVLLSHIGGMYDSDYFEDRLLEAQTPEELYDTVATVEQTALA